MAQLLLVNPSDRKGIEMATAKKKPRSAAQKAATKRMLAANRAARAAASAPAKKRKAAKKPAAVAAPKRAAKKSRTRRGGWPITGVAAASAAGRKLRYRRPNPIMDDIKSTFIPSAIGGGGALLLDVAMGLLPLPAAAKVGPMSPLVRVAGAVGIGVLAGMVVSKRTANQIAAGALTVTMYDLAKRTLRTMSGGRIPGLNDYSSMGAYGVGAYGVDGNDAPALMNGADDDDSLGEDDGMGYIDAGMTVGDLMPDGTISGFETGVYR